jgi:uncharacterized protein (TIGR03437 family)
MIHVRKTILVCSIALWWAQSVRAQTPPTYTITTIAGSGTPGYSGDGGPANQAELYLPFASVFTGGNLYIADQVNDAVRIVNGGNINTLAGDGTAGYSGDGKAASQAQLYDPTGIVVDAKGNVYVSDTRNQVVRMITTAGIISTFAGNNIEGAGISGDTGTAQSAQLDYPAGLALDANDNLYIADTANNKIRIVTQATGNPINTFAGNLFADYSGDGGPAIDAELNNPEGVAVDAAGNVYIADTLNHRIRMVTPDGNIHTVAGNGIAGHSGDGGQALEAELNHPEGVAVDTAGNIYIADTFNQRIRMVLPNGKIFTIGGGTGAGYTGDGGPALSATFTFPSSVFVDPQGNVYVTDSQNYVIREMSPSAAVPAGPGTPAISAGGVISASGFGAFPTIAPGTWIEIYGTNLAADARLWAASDFEGANAPTALDRTAVTIAGENAFIEYVSPGQVNAQIPSDIPPGTQPLVLSNATGISSAFNVTVVGSQPAFYAPPQLSVGGNQYIGALMLDGKTFVGPPGAFPGITSARAHPGQTITLYGVGFGAVNPPTLAGQVSPLSSEVYSFPVISIEGVQVEETYKGLAPGSVGLYQFNIVVPAVNSSDTAAVTLNINGVPGTQTLVTSIQNP